MNPSWPPESYRVRTVTVPATTDAPHRQRTVPVFVVPAIWPSRNDTALVLSVEEKSDAEASAVGSAGSKISLSSGASTAPDSSSQDSSGAEPTDEQKDPGNRTTWPSPQSYSMGGPHSFDR